MSLESSRGLFGAPARPDVVVVGARVAGAATALHLARAGHEVLILDRVGPPTDTTSTHALMRSGVLQLQRAGVLDHLAGTPAIRRIELIFDEELVSFPVVDEYGVDSYYAPRRTVLDPALLDAATSAGASFVSGVSVEGVVRNQHGTVVGVEGRSEAGAFTIPTKMVVGADGVNSRIAREVEASVLFSAPPSNAVVYAYYRGLEASGYQFRFTRQRNVGLIPTDDGLTLVFAGGPPGRADNDLDSTLGLAAPDLARSVHEAERVERFRRSNGIPSVLRDPVGDGWTLVGDAGFSEDPIAAHGITDALRDADLCAEAIDQGLRDPRQAMSALGSYRAVRDRFALPLLKATVPLSRYQWDGGEASRLLRQISDVAQAECELLFRRPRLALV